MAEHLRNGKFCGVFLLCSG